MLKDEGGRFVIIEWNCRFLLEILYRNLQLEIYDKNDQ